MTCMADELPAGYFFGTLLHQLPAQARLPYLNTANCPSLLPCAAAKHEPLFDNFIYQVLLELFYAGHCLRVRANIWKIKFLNMLPNSAYQLSHVLNFSLIIIQF